MPTNPRTTREAQAAEHQSIIDGIFAARRAQFGHDVWRMEGEGEGAPAAPAEPAAPATPAAPAPTPPPAAPAAPAESDTEDIASLPEWAQKVIADTRAENARSRVTAKTEAAEAAKADILAAITAALGGKPAEGDQPPTVEAVTADLTAAREQAANTARAFEVYKAATTVGANADRLTDSQRFMSTVNALDVTSDTFVSDVTKAVEAAITADPSLKGQAPSRSGTTPTGGPGQQVTSSTPLPMGEAVAASLGF